MIGSDTSNIYTFKVTRRYKDYNYVGEDTTYNVIVKSDSIENAEKKARELAEAPRPGASTDYRYAYKLDLLEVKEPKI